MLCDREPQMEVVIIPWEAGSAPPLHPWLSLARLASERGRVFFTGLCGACHATLALPHPFGVRTDSCPGRSALHRGWEGGLGQGGRPPFLSPCGVDVWVPGEWFCTSAVPLTPGGTVCSQVSPRSTWCAWGQAGGSWRVSSQCPSSPGASPERSVYARLGGGEQVMRLADLWKQQARGSLYTVSGPGHWARQ